MTSPLLLMRIFCLVVAASCISQGAVAQGERTFVVRSDDGLFCAAFDYAAGLMVTSSHCATSDTLRVSDGRSAFVLSQGDFAGSSGPFDGTDKDIAFLVPSAPRRALRIDRRRTDVGSILYLLPPGEAPRPCPLVEQRGLTLILDCYAEEGWSGSPIVRIGWFGARRVVGVLSGIEPASRYSWATHISAADHLRR